MARRRRSRGLRGAGTIDQLPSGRWRLRVPLDAGGRATYGTYVTEELAAEAQARWQLTRLLPDDDPQDVAIPASVAVGGVRCDEWFTRWQEAKKARGSLMRVNRKRGGAESTAARDRACWSKWWSPAIGARLPHTVTQADVGAVVDAMEQAGLAPLTIKTHWGVINAFFGWLTDEGVLAVSPIAKASVSVNPAFDRVRDIVVPDFRFIDMLSARLGDGQDRLVVELLLGTGGRRSEVAGMVVGDVDLAAERVWQEPATSRCSCASLRPSVGGRGPQPGWSSCARHVGPVEPVASLLRAAARSATRNRDQRRSPTGEGPEAVHRRGSGAGSGQLQVAIGRYLTV